MTKKLNTQPLYRQLRQVLVARIASGDWEPGQAIPNEGELARQYNLSPGTVRKALEWMEQAKLVVRMQGRGTFVRDPSGDDFIIWYERLRKADGSPLSDKVGTAVVAEGEARTDECARLDLRTGERVRRTTRARLLDRIPYMIETAVVPTALFPLDGNEAEADHTLLNLAKMCGVLLGQGEERISAVNATSELAASLACSVGTALLHLDRTVFTIDGTPAEWRLSYCRLVDHHYAAAVGFEG